MNDRVIPANLDRNSKEYKDIVAELLGAIDPSRPAGTTLCDAMMRLWPTPAFEAVVFRESSGTAEIYLRRRAMDDTAYPGEWHAPGSLYRSGEQDRDVAARLEKEFGAGIKRFDLVDKEITNEARGTVHSMVFLVQLAGDPRIDDRHAWFPVDHLPEVTVDLHHDAIIPKAFKAWQARRQR